MKNNEFTIFDGAMGSMLEGKIPEDTLPEELCLTSPKLIENIHRQYIDAGSDYITANTFGACSLVLKNENKEHLVEDLNRAGVQIAKSASNKNTKIIGSLGPTSLLPTLGNIDFETMAKSYCEQSKYLIDEGVDAILIETCQDILQTKSAIVGVKDAMELLGKEVPIFVSVTLEKSGAMLLGTSIGAVLATLAPYKPFAIGLNCATGPDEMKSNVHFLSEKSPFKIICQPNAGLPEVTKNGTHYPLAPKEFGKKVSELAIKYNIDFVGGCCGTTPEHIHELANNLNSKTLKSRSPKFKPALSSLFSAISLDQKPAPLIFAEQTNINGAKKFKRLIEEENFESAIDYAKDSAKGAHGLDICLSSPTGNEIERFQKIIPDIVKSVDTAIMIDSTEPEIIKSVLPMISGRPIINSINYEDIETKAKPILNLAKRYGAMVVGLTIDESGMAMTKSRKVEIAQKLSKLVEESGLSKEDILVDPLTFSLASGKDTKNSAKETLSSLEEINKFARTSLGVSNVSYGLSKSPRHALTSIFLESAVSHGLKTAIINPKRLLPTSKIPKDLISAGKKLIDGDDKYLKAFLEDIKFDTSTSNEKLDPKTALKQAVLTGSRSGLENIIETLVKTEKPSEIINKILLSAMKEVGELFGNGKLPLPFVLESAETMRKAIDLLSPFMTEEQTNRGTIVLATVRGDIHDIGKNLVDIILSHNGFKVINLGVKQPMEKICQVAKENNAIAIGLSALLTTSAKALADDIPIISKHDINIPVLIGGAALNQNFADEMIVPNYPNVIYCPNAISGLKAMEIVTSNTI